MNFTLPVGISRSRNLRYISVGLKRGGERFCKPERTRLGPDRGIKLLHNSAQGQVSNQPFKSRIPLKGEKGGGGGDHSDFSKGYKNPLSQLLAKSTDLSGCQPITTVGASELNGPTKFIKIVCSTPQERAIYSWKS